MTFFTRYPTDGGDVRDDRLARLWARLEAQRAAREAANQIQLDSLTEEEGLATSAQGATQEYVDSAIDTAVAALPVSDFTDGNNENSYLDADASDAAAGIAYVYLRAKGGASSVGNTVELNAEPTGASDDAKVKVVHKGGDDSIMQTQNIALEMKELSATPATPPAGYWKLYFLAGGLYMLDDGGVETQVA